MSHDQGWESGPEPTKWRDVKGPGRETVEVGKVPPWRKGMVGGGGSFRQAA